MSDDKMRQDFEACHVVPDDAYFKPGADAYKYEQYPSVDHPLNELYEAFCNGVEWEAAQRQDCEPLGFHSALKLASSVVNVYCQDNPNWHRKIAGTPIPNDLAVRMAKVFAGFYHLPEPPEDNK